MIKIYHVEKKVFRSDKINKISKAMNSKQKIYVRSTSFTWENDIDDQETVVWRREHYSI